MTLFSVFHLNGAYFFAGPSFFDTFIFPKLHFLNHLNRLLDQKLFNLEISFLDMFAFHDLEEVVTYHHMGYLMKKMDFLDTWHTVGFVTGSSQRQPLFLRTLSLYGITRWAHKYRSPILLVFKNKIAQCTIYLLTFVMGYYLFIYWLYFHCKRRAHSSFLDFFVFSKIFIFHFYILKELTIWREIFL